MNALTRHLTLSISTTLFLLTVPALASAGWNGLNDVSNELGTDQYGFQGNFPEQIQSNENYYDGDFADFDGDGITDRSLGSRYGLLFNSGGGYMWPYAGYTNFLFRGRPGAAGWGEDAFQWADVDNDGDFDNLSGGNGEPLTLQTNRAGRFSTSWQQNRSALNIVNTDVNGDGFVDFAVAHAFCRVGNCGGPVQFSLLINDGTGNYTEESVARGLNYPNTNNVVGVASGDVDNDGDYDLVIEHGTVDAVEIAFNDGAGNFSVVATPLSAGCSGFGQALNLGDIDDDGDLDIVLGRVCWGRTSSHPEVNHIIGINDGSGTFTNESANRWDVTQWGGPGRLAGNNAKLVDLDYDGDLDFVALRTRADWANLFDHHMQVFFNDGTGVFSYSDTHSDLFKAAGTALGADVDITDLDQDGDYDLWLGIGGDRVRIIRNDYDPEDGLRADQVRDLQVEASNPGATVISWTAPPFATTARYYKVYRSTSPGLERRDRELIHIVGERHQDEGFAAPITRHTTTAQLGDPAVELDGQANLIRFTDDNTIAGVTYYYTVTHVGGENTEGAIAPEVVAVVSGGSEDGLGPQITIVGPTEQDWGAYPRIVIHSADGGSGVDLDSLSISLDADLGDPNNGGIAAGGELAGLAYRADAGATIIPLAPPLALPDQAFVTLDVKIADNDANSSMAQRQFFVSTVAAELPSASMRASATDGMAPAAIEFDGSASTDGDGKLLRWEWYFGDGTTATGRQVSHTFVTGGDFDVMLLVRDNDGGVSTTIQRVSIEGPMPECTAGESQPCDSGAERTDNIGRRGL